jgi:hypothetical protein
MKSTPTNKSVIFFGEAEQRPRACEHDKPYKRLFAAPATQPFDFSKNWRKTLKN